MRNKLLQSQEHRRLAELVRIMALEIEHLNEETKQLGAAVHVYREVVRTRRRGFCNGKTADLMPSRGSRQPAWIMYRRLCGQPVNK